jgi:hypothetical protein
MLFSFSLATELTTNAEVLQDDLTRANNCLAKADSLTALLTNLNLPSFNRLNADGTNMLNYMYRDAIIYQDIFAAYNSNIFTKKGTPNGWDETSYVQNPWNSKRILKIGGGPNFNGNGMLINVPDGGFNVLWLRVLNDRWMTFRCQSLNDESQVNFNSVQEIYAAGYRKLNQYGPDGGSPDSYWDLHHWLPIPLRQPGQYMCYSDKNSDDWISGIAFSKNLWNHALNSAVAFLWKLNPQTGDINWVGENWNNDQLAYFPAGSNTEVSVPVVYSGKDKIIYIVEHNNNWTGCQHGNVYINGQQVERFRTSYSNPFATHYNSKIYDRYMATKIPASLVGQNDKFVRLKIDMTGSNHHIHFREIGTHDYI